MNRRLLKKLRSKKFGKDPGSVLKLVFKILNRYLTEEGLESTTNDSNKENSKSKIWLDRNRGPIQQNITIDPIVPRKAKINNIHNNNNNDNNNNNNNTDDSNNNNNNNTNQTGNSNPGNDTLLIDGLQNLTVSTDHSGDDGDNNNHNNPNDINNNIQPKEKEEKSKPPRYYTGEWESEWVVRFEDIHSLVSHRYFDLNILFGS